jgi:hypothetical protein
MADIHTMYRIEDEFVGIKLNEKRLDARFCRTMETLFRAPQRSIYGASEDKAERKAIYRLLGNEKLNIEKVEATHRAKTIERIAGYGGTILAIQDTTGLNYAGQKEMEGLGYNCEQSLGLNLHSCLAVTGEGVVLGVLRQSAATRSEAKKEQEKKSGHKYTPISEKESNRWLETMREAVEGLPEGQEVIHVCDREGDMYELFNEAETTGQKFLIRASYNRRVKGNGKEGEGKKQYLQDEIRGTASLGEVKVRLPRDSRRKKKARDATLEIRYGSYEVERPDILSAAKETVAERVRMNIIYVREAGNAEGVEWYLLTNCEIGSAEAAYRMVGYYLQRWKIEEFHHVLKSGCTVEKLQESTVGKTTLLVYLYSVIAVFILNLTYSGRVTPELSCEVLFEEEDWKLLYRLGNRTKEDPEGPYPMRDVVTYLGRLGGPKRSAREGQPGVKTIWQGLAAFSLLCNYRDFCGAS